MTVSPLLQGGAAAVCLAWTALVLAAARGRAARLPAAACAAAALWAAAAALSPLTPLHGLPAAAETPERRA